MTTNNYQNLEDNDQFKETHPQICDCGTNLDQLDPRTHYIAEPHWSSDNPDEPSCVFCSQECLEIFLDSNEGQDYQWYSMP